MGPQARGRPRGPKAWPIRLRRAVIAMLAFGGGGCAFESPPELPNLIVPSDLMESVRPSASSSELQPFLAYETTSPSSATLESDAVPSPTRPSAEDLSRELADPISPLFSIPFQNNVESGGGPHHDGWRYTFFAEPVVPIPLNKDWRLLSITQIPVAHQERLFDSTIQTGLGDIVENLYLTPAQPLPGHIQWGLGPSFGLPTATEDFLASDRWTLGPTGVLLRQDLPWTYGILITHQWSIGPRGMLDIGQPKPNINTTFLQPFAVYHLGQGLSLQTDSESFHDWTIRKWTVPIYVGVAQVFANRDLPISLGFGPRVFVVSPRGNVLWGLRLTLTLIFPRK